MWSTWRWYKKINVLPLKCFFTENDTYQKQNTYNKKIASYQREKSSTDNIVSNKNIVGVLDTGIDISHPNIKNSIFINFKEIPNNGLDDDGNGYIDDINGWDFANGDKTVFDDSIMDIHGTLVTGILINNLNESKISSCIQNIKILPLKFINKNTGYINDIIKALDYSNSLGVKIINCSFGIDKYNPILKTIINDSNMIFICAVGNNNDDLSLNPTYPACFNMPNILAVAAIDNNKKLDKSTNYGQNVKLVAPGVNIKSTLPNNSYSNCSGSSFAVPFVTSIAAIIRSISPNITNGEIVSIIEANTIKSSFYKGMSTDCGEINIKQILLKLKQINSS